MMPFQFVGGKRMLYVCTVIVKPYFFGWVSFAEKQHVGFYALRIENTCRQAQDSM